MLVLTRKLDETIVINGDIRVTVVAIHANQVRLGFEAPGSVAILREEVRDRVGTGVVHAAPAAAGTAAGRCRVDRPHRLSYATCAPGRSADEKNSHTLEYFP